MPPQPEDANQFTLTLEHGLGHTIYFSDRPERIVGAAPTATFPRGLPFDATNPPNAALVMDVAADDQDVVVMELTRPAYDEGSRTATYTATVLSDAELLGVTFQERPRSAANLPVAFGTASLFIDGCPDRVVVCSAEPLGSDMGNLGTKGMCWTWHQFACEPCVAYTNACQDMYPLCNYHCSVQVKSS